MGGAARPVTPEEQLEVMARELPPDLRLAGRMPGKTYLAFHNAETILANMLEIGAIDDALYKKVLDGRFSFKNMFPARAAVDWVKAVSEMKNPGSFVAMVSNAAGAKIIGNEVVPIMRADVVGLKDSRSIMEVIRDNLVKEQLSFHDGLEILETVEQRLKQEGVQDDVETAEALDTIRSFKSLMRKLGV
jgi:hypothetical protein